MENRFKITDCLLFNTIQSENKLGSYYGHFVFMLHAHIPYVVSHGKWPYGTDWLAEAAAETYLPLLNTLSELENEGMTKRNFL